MVLEISLKNNNNKQNEKINIQKFKPLKLTKYHLSALKLKIVPKTK